MNDKTEEKKPPSTEQRIYEFFGIRFFRKFVLQLERCRHRKDGCKNVNYHLPGSGIYSVRQFTGYLLYNAVCHCIGLFFVVLYFAFMRIAGVRSLILDISVIVLFFVNLYCILLQRYIFIRARRSVARRTRVRNDRMAEKIKRLSQEIELRAYPECAEEYALIERIRNSLRNGTDCLIEESDVPALRRISESACGLFASGRYSPKRIGKAQPLSALLLRIPKHPFVIGRVTRRAAALQNLFHLEDRTDLLSGACVITQNYACEQVYGELIQSASFDTVEFVFDVLFAAYRNTLLSQKRTQV